jgi:hypothetical protein
MNWDQLSVTGRYDDWIHPDILGIPLERWVDFEKCSDIYQPAVRFGEFLILGKKGTYSL